MVIHYFSADPAKSRSCFAIDQPWQLTLPEGIGWLEQTGHAAAALPPHLALAMARGELTAVNNAHPRRGELPWRKLPGRGLRLHLLAAGDVGATLLLGLKLLAGDTVSAIGIYDVEQQRSRRWEFELNQVAGGQLAQSEPWISVLEREQLFDGDVFVFCASAGVPPLSEKGDVRLAQYQKNAAIIRDYARQARQCRFDGLFAVVSDPVDLLCREAFYSSNYNDAGAFDGLGLLPEQVEGFGLGVMHARAAYYAHKDSRFASYLKDGRAYGPHGQELVIANSLTAYDDSLSRELTALAVNANIRSREMGFKPYVAPALSSGALSLLAALRGEWHDSATFLGGVFLGARNRRSPAGLQLETNPLPPALRQRLEQCYQALLRQGDAHPVTP